MRYIFQKEIGKTYNKNYIILELESNDIWVAKLSKSLEEKGVYFTDLNHRAVLANRLANILNIPMPEYKLVNVREISNLNVDRAFNLISDEVWLSRYAGITLDNYLQNNEIENLKNISSLWDNIGFNIWLGNYDRKDVDILVDEKEMLSFIDYHLWGPGFNENNLFALGAYAEAYDIKNTLDTGWCIGAPFLIDYIREKSITFKSFQNIIAKIEALSENDINHNLDGLSFVNEEGVRLNVEYFSKYLVKRKSLIRLALRNWIDETYPRGNRPNDEMKNDDIYTNL